MDKQVEKTPEQIDCGCTQRSVFDNSIVHGSQCKEEFALRIRNGIKFGNLTVIEEFELIYKELTEYARQSQERIAESERLAKESFNIGLKHQDRAKVAEERIAELESELEVQKESQQCMIESNHNNFMRAEAAELAVTEATAKAWEEASHYVDFAIAEQFCTRAQKIREGDIRSHSTV